MKTKLIVPSTRRKTLDKSTVDQYYGYPLGIVDTNCNLLWKEGYFGSGVKIGVIDTGIDTHSDLSGRVVYRKSFVGAITDDHGTHVAGTIAASADDGYGLYGIAPRSSLYDLQVLGKNGGDATHFSRAIDEAIRLNLDIVNMSLGTPTEDPIITSAVKKAYTSGIILVAASGNEGYGSILYPGAVQECISVGNYDIKSDKYNPTSSANKFVDVCAPGTNVISCAMNDQYAVYTGTSMATPHVSGLSSLYLEKFRSEFPGLDRKALRDKVTQELFTNVIDRSPVGKDLYHGFGQVRYKPSSKPSVKYVATTKYNYIGTRLEYLGMKFPSGPSGPSGSSAPSGPGQEKCVIM